MSLAVYVSCDDNPFLSFPAVPEMELQSLFLFCCFLQLLFSPANNL